MPYKDLEKRRECRRRWYAKNKKSEKAHVARRRKEIRDWFVDYRSNLQCSMCKENHPATLDFHHKDSGTKDFTVTHMTYYGYSRDAIKKEIEKCIILCANCHRKLHFNNKKPYISKE